MARKVKHYSDCGNFYNYYQEHNKSPKTICGRDMTSRYLFTDDVNRVTCSRCLKKLEKSQMLDGQLNGRQMVINTISDIGGCGDDDHDAYLQRLGIG